MPQVQLSLSWDAYQKNICTGLSQLQQCGEFVDMTLAADGHHVKVHQMVLSLVSPYIKDLISSAQCPHPIIFLNNISYTTLCSILEYIYTGQVLVARDNLNELLAAGRALHIRGLREMDEPDMPQPKDPITMTDESPPRKKNVIEKLKEDRDRKKSQMKEENSTPSLPICKIFVDESDTNVDTPIELEQKPSLITGDCKTNTNDETVTQDCTNSDVEMLTPEATRRTLMNPKLQYTVSNQGGLQVIYNRYIYHLRYYGKRKRIRLWRCIDYSTSLKCPANICTDENNQVTTRSFTHNHPFHDNKVLKKLSFGRIYPAFSQAESLAMSKRKERRVPEDNFV